MVSGITKISLLELWNKSAKMPREGRKMSKQLRNNIRVLNIKSRRIYQFNFMDVILTHRFQLIHLPKRSQWDWIKIAICRHFSRQRNQWAFNIAHNRRRKERTIILRRNGRECFPMKNMLCSKRKRILQDLGTFLHLSLVLIMFPHQTTAPS